MNNELKISIYLGISIFMNYNYVFEQLIKKNTFYKIYVSLNRKILNHNRNTFSDDFYDKYYEIMKIIFNNKNIICEYDKNYPLVQFTEIAGGDIKYYIMDHLIKKKYDDFDYKYITLSAKILNIKREIFDSIKNELFFLLNLSGLKIVLLGERNVTGCNEYNIHETYSIYDECIQNLKNIYDCTIKESNNNNDIDDLLRTFYILNNSNLNIFLSNGGISKICPYLSNKILGLTYNHDLHDKNNFLHDDNKNINMFSNEKEFIEFLKNFCNSQNI